MTVHQERDAMAKKAAKLIAKLLPKSYYSPVESEMYVDTVALIVHDALREEDKRMAGASNAITAMGPHELVALAYGATVKAQEHLVAVQGILVRQLLHPAQAQRSPMGDNLRDLVDAHASTGVAVMAIQSLLVEIERAQVDKTEADQALADNAEQERKPQK